MGERQEMQEGGMSRNALRRKYCPGNVDNTRLHVANVLPPIWLDRHRDLIAAVALPPLSPFSTPVSPDLPSASSPTPPPTLHYGSVFPTHIHMLPNELMLTIFSHVSSDDLEHRVSNVCSRWRTLAQHTSLRRHMRLQGGDGVSTDEARRILCAAKKLVELRLNTRADLVPLIEEAVKSRCSLRKLIIKRVCPLPDRLRASEALRRLLLNSNLEELTISFSSTSMLQRPFFTRLKPRLANIRKLNLSFIPDLRHDDLGRIVFSCPRLVDLRLLMLSRHPKALIFNDLDLMLVGFLSKTLEVLKIEAANVTDVGMKMLTNCEHLRILSLREVALVSVRGLLALRFFRKLESLYLSGANSVSSRGWAVLFLRPRWPMLRKLALVQCALTDLAATFLIPNYPGLRYLNILGCTELSTNMIKRLVAGLKRLEVIALCLTQIEGCLYWIAAYAPSISKIIYHSCSLPNDAHLKMYEPFAERRGDSTDVPTRSIILSLDETDLNEMA